MKFVESNMESKSNSGLHDFFYAAIQMVNRD